MDGEQKPGIGRSEVDVGLDERASNTVDGSSPGEPAAASGGSSARTHEMLGAVVGSYRLVKALGAGGMAEVYLAEHTRIDRRTAVKFLLPEWLGNQEAVSRFFSEARATSLIHHPGIVEVLDCAVLPTGQAYIVMELLDGESLSARLSNDPEFGVDVRQALEVAGSVASALRAAHNVGIIHRDLKPGNIFLVRAPEARFGFRVKVLDFGIAKLAAERERGGADVSSATRSGYILGTPGYISPEQCNNARGVDHRTDIYSLGCILFEMLAGQTPFRGPTFEQLLAHIGRNPPRLRVIRPVIPPALESLVERMLAKAPEERPPSMQAVEVEIARALRALRPPATLTLPAPRRLRVKGAATAWWQAAHDQRVRSLAKLSLLVLVLGFGAALPWAMHRDRSPSETESTAEPTAEAASGPRNETPPTSKDDRENDERVAATVTAPAPPARAARQDEGQDSPADRRPEHTVSPMNDLELATDAPLGAREEGISLSLPLHLGFHRPSPGARPPYQHHLLIQGGAQHPRRSTPISRPRPTRGPVLSDDARKL